VVVPLYLLFCLIPLSKFFKAVTLLVRPRLGHAVFYWFGHNKISSPNSRPFPVMLFGLVVHTVFYWLGYNKISSHEPVIRICCVILKGSQDGEVHSGRAAAHYGQKE
jgi:hypothetical protein